VRVALFGSTLNYSIEAEGLTKRFGSFVAVRNVGFRVKEGEILGMLGANGAGKTTVIRMLCGLLKPSSGSAVVAGFDVRAHPEEVKRRIGYMSQRFSLYEDLTVRENIRFFGGIYGISNSDLDERSGWVLEIAGLRAHSATLVRELSVGWKQRLAVGCAVLHRPKIVFLDEPTSGVDPASRRRFWDLINELSAEGVTSVVTTHYLDEAEYCNRLIMIQAGSVVAEGSPHELKTRIISAAVYEVDCSDAMAALGLLQKESWVERVSLFGAYLHVCTNYKGDLEQRIEGCLSRSGISVQKVEPITASLEDVFIQLIEERLQG
jgi:ABC-2 type transport system ATP-binding protein